jgi:class 3 adenylate cyclase
MRFAIRSAAIQSLAEHHSPIRMSDAKQRGFRWRVALPRDMAEGFAEYHFTTAIWIFRIAVGAIIAFDALTIASQINEITIWRSIILTALLALSFHRGAHRYWQPVMWGFVLWVTYDWWMEAEEVFVIMQPKQWTPAVSLAVGYSVAAGFCCIIAVTFFALKLRFAWAFTAIILEFIIGGLVLLRSTPELFNIMFQGPGLLNIFFFMVISSAAAYFLEQVLRESYLRRELLNREHARSEGLLLNILPKPIADRLKDGAGTIADSFAEVTVMFADIVGFTPLTARSTPQETVAMLNKIFSRFDRLAGERGLEKIKTIGDAYMVVGGIPSEMPDHAGAIMTLAIAMQDEVARSSSEFKEPLQIRIGISTGPIVAGVIGEKKFIYDLWGDTVNMASRMESHGEPGGIQVMPRTYELLRARWTFVERQIEVKGRGRTTVYRHTGVAAQPPLSDIRAAAN